VKRWLAQFAEFARFLLAQILRMPTSSERFFFRDPDGYIFEVVATDRT
jgi:hypothetical protein